LTAQVLAGLSQPTQLTQLPQTSKVTKTPLVCYCCGEIGYFAQNCLLEKKPDRKEAKQKQSELEKKNALLKKTPKVKTTFETPDQKNPMDVTPYDIVENILNLKANITLVQALKYPDQKQNLAKIMKRPKQSTTEANSLETDKVQKTVAIRYHVKIKGTPVIAILDLGAAVSIITNKLIKRLGLALTKESKTVVVTANGGRSKALGIVENIKI
ncbi:24707_t:CDS:2, partial [Dentiscutata erythropus]